MILLIATIFLAIAASVVAERGAGGEGGFIAFILVIVLSAGLQVTLASSGVDQVKTTTVTKIKPFNGNYVTKNDEGYFVQSDKSIVFIPEDDVEVRKGDPRVEDIEYKGSGLWLYFDQGTETVIYTNTGVAIV